MDPKQMVINMMKSNMNPFYTNLINLAEKGNIKELENIAQNMCRQQNVNFEQAFSNFKGSYAQTINNNFRR